MFPRRKTLCVLHNLLHSPLDTRGVVCRAVSEPCFAQFSSSAENLPLYTPSPSSEKRTDLETKHDADLIIATVIPAKDEAEAFQSLLREFPCNGINLTHSLVTRLLHRFEDDYKSALGVFRWVEARSGLKPSPDSYEKLVDILGKAKQMERMKALVDEMREHNLVSLNTVAKMMRRFAGAGCWKEAVKMFDELETFGLDKNTESMNILLDTLCKEKRVEQARTVFMELRSHISPDANTFTIFINGWCKIKRVEEALWTFQEMRGNGFKPCVVSYSIIIQFYCSQGSFYRAYELLDEMQAQGCVPNVVTFTTIMNSLTKSGDLNEAVKIAERVKLVGCRPDTQFYNALIHTLGRLGRVEETLSVFTEEMPRNKINPNTSTYNTMIAMFCHHRQEKRAVQFLANLEKTPYCKPDVQSFYPLIKLYLRDGKTDKVLVSLLDDMVGKHHLSLNLASFTLLIHGLCRAKKCEWAYGLFREMLGQNIKPKYVTCSLLLQEIKQKNMHDAAEVIEDYMKKMKSL